MKVCELACNVTETYSERSHSKSTVGKSIVKISKVGKTIGILQGKRARQEIAQAALRPRQDREHKICSRVQEANPGVK